MYKPTIESTFKKKWSSGATCIHGSTWESGLYPKDQILDKFSTQLGKIQEARLQKEVFLYTDSKKVSLMLINPESWKLQEDFPGSHL